MAEHVGQLRISLSGTPVENKLQDLHSQFEYILPGTLAVIDLILFLVFFDIGHEVLALLNVFLKVLFLEVIQKNVASY